MPRAVIPPLATQTFYHGTGVASGIELLRGAALSAVTAANQKIDGSLGFYLATAAEFLALRRLRGVILRYEFSVLALDRLVDNGSRLEPIPQGGFPTSFPGLQLMVPVQSFEAFNLLRTTGQIAVSAWVRSKG